MRIAGEANVRCDFLSVEVSSNRRMREILAAKFTMRRGNYNQLCCATEREIFIEAEHDFWSLPYR